MKRLIKKAAFFSLFLFYITSVSAQTMPVNTPSIDAGMIDKASMENLNNAHINKSLFKKDKPISAGISQEEHDEIPKGPGFKVDEVVFWGNTSISSKKLSKFVEPIIGKEICFTDLKEIVDKITKYYHEEGYVTSRAYIPPQKVENNKVEIAVEEGVYGDIKVKGNKWSSKEHVKDILSSNGIKKYETLNVYNLDSSIKEIEGHTYMEGKISVDKSKIYDDIYNIELEIEDRFPLDFSVSWDDEGQAFTGTHQATIMATYGNITGKGDSLSAGTILSSGVIGAVSSYNVPLNDGKTRFTANYSYTNSAPGDIFKQYGIIGNTHTYYAGFTRKVHMGKRWNIEADIGLEAKNSVTEMEMFNVDINRYNLRTLKTGITAVKKDESGMWLSRAEARTGLPICNATEISEDYGYADSKYIKTTLDVHRYQKLPFDTMGVFKSTFQYSPDKLLAPEKMLLGGSSTVRGYDPMLLMGDSGFNASFEVRKQLPFIDKILPAKLKQYEKRFQVGAFYDCGYVRNIHEYEPTHTNFLQSVGCSFYVPITKFLTANMNVGMPVGAKVFDNQDVRFSFNLTTDVHNFWSKHKKDENL